MNTGQPLRLDRTAFRMGKADESWLQQGTGKAVNWQERLKLAHYLISTAYNLPTDAWPQMDKTVFQIKKR